MAKTTNTNGTIDGVENTHHTSEDFTTSTRKSADIIAEFKKAAAEDFRYGIRLLKVVGNVPDDMEHTLSAEWPMLIVERSGANNVSFKMTNGKVYTF